MFEAPVKEIDLGEQFWRIETISKVEYLTSNFENWCRCTPPMSVDAKFFPQSKFSSQMKKASCLYRHDASGGAYKVC